MTEKTDKFRGEVQKKRKEIAASIKKFWKDVEEKRKKLFAPKRGTALKKAEKEAKKTKAKKAKTAKSKK